MMDNRAMAGQLEAIHHARDKIVNSALIAFSIVGLVLIPVSLLRSISIGWQPVMAVHLVLWLSLTGVTVFRHRLPFPVRAWILISMFLVGCLGGLMTFGLIGLGVPALLMTTVLTTLLFGSRIGWAMAGLSLAMIGAVGVSMNVGWIPFELDTARYAAAPTSWVFSAVGFLMFISVCITGLSWMHRALIEAQISLEEQKGNLEQLVLERTQHLEREISERKQAEESLTESDQRLKLSLESGQIGTFYWNIQDGSHFWDNRMHDIWGLKMGTYQGTMEADFLASIHSDDLVRVTETISLTLSKGTEYDIEYRILVRDNEVRHVHARAILLCDNQGRPQQLIGTCVDITERKQSEEEIKTYAKLFKKWKDSKFIGIIQSNATGDIIEANDTILAMLGYSRQDLLDGTLDWTKWTPPEFLHLDMKAMEEAAEKGFWTAFEKEYFHKEGRRIPIIIGGSKYKENPDEYIVFIIDISDRKQLETQLRHAQRMEAVGQLTGGVAHDFNNLLAVMLGNAELLEDMAGEDKEAKKFIETIKEAVLRGSSLTSRLLAFSRQSTLVPIAADVRELIGGLHDMLQRALGATVELSVGKTADLWPAMIDMHQFENALVNLALNARDAMPQGGMLTIETANVTLDKIFAEQHEEVTPGDYVEVAVSDTGTGIPPDVLEKVFEPFFTTKEVGKGSGLGLSMVFGFVKQSKGHLTISSEIGHGTSVKLYLPRSQDQATETDAKEDVLEHTQGSERILVVEDEAGVRKISVAILVGQGYEVVEAGNGEEAIGHLKAGQPFDLLFTDVVLPGGMNGAEIAKEARRMQPDIMVLYTTGYAENTVIHHGKLDRDVNLVNKPYRRTELLEKVQEILGNKGV